MNYIERRRRRRRRIKRTQFAYNARQALTLMKAMSFELLTTAILMALVFFGIPLLATILGIVK